MIAGLSSFLEAVGKNLGPCLFQILEVTHIPQFVALSSIFKANNMAPLSNPASSMSLSLSLPPPSTFFFGCAGSSLLCRLFSSCSEQGLLSSCGAWASHCGEASTVAEHRLQGVWASAVLVHGLSNCSSWALQHRLNRFGAQAWLHHGMWDLPGSGIKPISTTLAGRFFTTGPPGKPPFPF